MRRTVQSVTTNVRQLIVIVVSESSGFVTVTTTVVITAMKIPNSAVQHSSTLHLAVRPSFLQHAFYLFQETSSM